MGRTSGRPMPCAMSRTTSGARTRSWRSGRDAANVSSPTARSYTEGQMMTALLLLALAGPALPDDARLDPVRPGLAAAVERAAGAGLPADVLVLKVREGLAKGVDPARIQAAVDRLAASLA